MYICLPQGQCDIQVSVTQIGLESIVSTCVDFSRLDFTFRRNMEQLKGIIQEISPNLNKETIIDEIKIALCVRDSITYNEWKEYEFNINHSFHWQETLLHLAAASGNMELVQVIVQNGATINEINHFKDTPLHLAAGGGHADIVEFLVRNGAYTNVKNKNGDKPLHLAAQNNHLEVVKHLVETTNINSKNLQGKAPVDCAREKGYEEIMQYIGNCK